MAVIVDTGDHTLLKREASLRRLAGGLSTNDIDNTAVDERLTDGDSWVLLMIGLTTIASGDANFNNFITASDKYGAHLVLLEIPGQMQNGESMLKDSRMIVTAINGLAEDQGTSGGSELFVTAGTEGNPDID